jgi:uncharacterized membrane protein
MERIILKPYNDIFAHSDNGSVLGDYHHMGYMGPWGMWGISGERIAIFAIVTLIALVLFLIYLIRRSTGNDQPVPKKPERIGRSTFSIKGTSEDKGGSQDSKTRSENG